MKELRYVTVQERCGGTVQINSALLCGSLPLKIAPIDYAGDNMFSCCLSLTCPEYALLIFSHSSDYHSMSEAHPLC